MKKLTIIFLLLAGCFTGPNFSAAQHHTKTEYVLICNSRSSYAYHRYECSGLSRCRHGISKVTKAQAIRMGYRPCKICY